MSFFDFLEKMQKKPEASRKKIAVITALAATAIIIAVWFTTFSFKKWEISDRGEKIKAPFDFIKEDIKNFYGFIQGTAK